ncbi:site-2 protease family protein [Phragmitibacter flavus]|uniref:Zinc metalloprotease n=1 Tax=Phragmitibacter flavus TaxID=2576071 RepID=A0A5R8KCH0_9BACT|nr:site-2 protease family protein [Phragmitibacter flavus]TLD70014.1 site-2 protease family protein [Phragmitibacter flavus]
MKRWSFSIATVAGTEVRIHATFLLLLAFIGWQASQVGGLEAARNAVLFIVAMFACVLLHEFGHVFAARRYGILTPDITLLPIGGLARLERMPKEPVQELVVALAGPAVNVVIAGLIIGSIQVMPPVSFDIDPHGRSFFVQLAQWNIIMVLFNMIPAFPMDGGRVLRAVLAMLTGNYAKSTQWAATIGQGFAVIGAVAAMFFFKNPFLIIIAIFIFLSAGQEAAYVNEQESMDGMKVRDAMMTNFQTLGDHSRLQDAVTLLLAGSQHDFPVVDRGGGFVGLLRRKNLISALSEHGPQHPVAEVMESCDILLEPQQALTEAMDKLRQSECPALPVMDPLGGGLRGLLTAENIGEMIMVRSAMMNRDDRLG